MSNYTRPRLDPAPIRRWMELHEVSHRELGERCGMEKKHVQGLLLRKVASGGNRVGLPIDKAEDFAFALGFHPVELWGDDYLDAALWEPTYSMHPKAVWRRKNKARKASLA